MRFSCSIEQVHELAGFVAGGRVQGLGLFRVGEKWHRQVAAREEPPAPRVNPRQERLRPRP
jgi:hypothetical protein